MAGLWALVRAKWCTGARARVIVPVIGKYGILVLVRVLFSMNNNYGNE